MRAYIHTVTCIHACIHAYILHVCVCVCVRICVYIYIYTHIYIYIHKYIYIYIQYICVCVSVRSFTYAVIAFIVACIYLIIDLFNYLSIPISIFFSMRALNYFLFSFSHKKMNLHARGSNVPKSFTRFNAKRRGVRPIIPT